MGHLWTRGASAEGLGTMGDQRGGPENPRSQPSHIPWRIHGAAIYGNMDPINIPPMLAYIPYMDPMGMLNVWYIYL